MARNFRIRCHEKNDNLYVRPCGTLDGSSAWELINFVNHKWPVYKCIYIDTDGLTGILPFGSAIFKSELPGGIAPADRLVFAGRNGAGLAPAGCRVLPFEDAGGGHEPGYGPAHREKSAPSAKAVFSGNSRKVIK